MKKIILLLMALVASMAGWAQTFTVENTNNRFTIKRSGSNLPAQTVRYRTVSLSALAGVHFTAASDTLQFAAGETQRTVIVNETPDVDEAFRFQTTTDRTYRFEVLKYNGTFLASVNRSMEYGSTYQHTASYVNKSVTDLVYFNNSGSVMSGSGNKYLDVSYSSSSWIQVTDGGYSQAVHSVSTGDLFHGSTALRTYLDNQSNKVYATVYFQQKEEQDGYQYIQILADNPSTYDGNDPNGAVDDPSRSLYKACFILSYNPSGSVMSDTHYQFFPHRYDYVDKAAETSAGLTRYEFDYDNSHLYQQKYKSTTYNAANNGALNLTTYVKSLNIRFDAAGSGGDTWDFKNLKVRLALVDEVKPSPVAGSAQVSAGPYVLGTKVYVSVPFSEIVTAPSSATLTTSWGTLSYFDGSGSNVLTFSGNINAAVGTQLTISALSSGIADLAGNTLTTTSVSKQFNATVITEHTITLPGETPNGTVTCGWATAIVGEPVTFTATPDAPFVIATVDVMNGSTPVPTTAGSNGTYTFVMPDADVTVSAEFGLPIDMTNFPDTNFRNYLHEQEYGTDNIITSSEIAGITSLLVALKDISDLTGIRYFTALKSLYCGGNQLTSLDVSHNTALEGLYCSNNQLTALDLTQNTALTRLECDHNQLTALDLSHNTALTKLACHANQLTSLDVSHNTALTEFVCYKNQLTALDVSQNTALTELNCNNNQLTALNVSNNTALTKIYCYDNRINAVNMAALVASLPTVAGGRGGFRVIDLSSETEQNVITTTQVATAKGKNWGVRGYKNGDWVEYDGVILIDAANFPDANFRNYLLSKDYGSDSMLTMEEIAGISTLSLGMENISDLTGIEHFTALEWLYCNDNQLTALDLSHNTALKGLYCGSNQLTVLNVSNNTALTTLYCGGNSLTALDVSQNTALTMLDCNNNQLTALDVSHNTALTALECNNNQLTALNVLNNTALTEIYCYNNRINAVNMAALVASLPTVAGGNGAFRVIDLSSDTEQNVITTTQVATARGKGWRVLGCTNHNWEDYDGVLLIDATNFPDANFRNYLLSKDYGSDGALTMEEIAGIIQIYVAYKSIADLTGIEHFTALKQLLCNGNHLTALDVSHNTALTRLDCNNNRLTALDVSQNTALTSLSCGGNQLGTLDVSHNTALEVLECYSNELTSLDVSHNTALTMLYCHSNLLTSLDMSLNTALTYLGCGGNQLGTLDVSHNTALTTLECGSNQLTALDVSHNTLLTTLECGGNPLGTLDVSHNTALTHLDCNNNQLTSLDVSHNTALTTLECDKNQIYGENMAALVACLPTVAGVYGEFRVIDRVSHVEQNVISTTQVATARGKNWSVLGYGDYGWQEYDGTPEGLPIIAAYFPDENFRNFLLSKSYGSDRVLTDEEIAGITEIIVAYKSIADLTGIEHFTALKLLYCNGNALTVLDVSHNTALTRLECQYNRLTALDVSHNTALTTLECGSNHLTALDVSQNTALKILDCGRNSLDLLDVSHNTALERLKCYENSLTALDVRQNAALTWLECHTNSLTALDLSHNTALGSLFCSNNQIYGDNMAALVASLHAIEDDFGELYVIDLDSETEQNVITTTQVATARGKNWTVLGFTDENGWQEYDGSPEGLPIVAAYFPDANFRNFLLSQSYGSDRVLTDEEIAGITSLSLALKNISDLTGIGYFTALKQLYCGGNQLTSLDLSHNTALTKLACGNNRLTALDVSHNTALTYLNCSRNPLDSLDVSHNTALEELQCYSNGLTSLDLSQNTALEYLECADNQLTSLDLSQNTALGSLDCAGNQLTSLDLSQNTALTRLECDNNQIYGENMTALVASLRAIEDDFGELYVIDLDSETEQNVITTTQVATARGKNWMVYGSTNGYLDEYDGSEPTFAITLPSEFEHGTVTADKANAAEGETVTLTVIPEDGYELQTLTVTTVDSPSGAPMQVRRRANVDVTPGVEPNTFTFEMPDVPVTINATFVDSTVTALEDIDAARTRNGQRYNLLGQPVSDEYKGIVIENGKKRVIK